MKIILSLTLVILSLIGLAEASYITYVDSQGLIPPCSEAFQCEKVLTSPYSNIGPLPISALGIVYYTAILILAIPHYIEADLKKIFSPLKKINFPIRPLDLLLIGTGFGLLFSLYLPLPRIRTVRRWS